MYLHRVNNLGNYAKKGYTKGISKPKGFGEKVRNSLLGKPLSEERKKKISEATKGRTPWNKGLHHSEETKRKIGKKSKERGFSQLAREKAKELLAGPNNRFYIDGRSLRPEYNSFVCRRRRTKKLRSEGSHTMSDWINLKNLYKNICLCCKRREPEITLTEDHIIPLSMGGTDFIWNIQPLCQSCNSRKHTKSIDFRTTN